MAFDSMAGLTGWDLTGFHEGHDTECWRRLGAVEATVRDSERGELTGTRFSVWAPNAKAVRLVGDFNWWNGEGHYLQLVPGSGVWALFVEGVGSGNLYKFEVLGSDDVWRLKADPMARFCEAPPHNASIVYQSQYQWDDDEWLWYRGEAQAHRRPMSVYEVHLGSWRKGLTYLELADQLVEYASWQGYTHIEFMPVAHHPYEGSWGYHVTGYFAPMSKFGSPDEFRYLVDRLHQAGIGVLVDWVPGHFATDPWALQRFDGTALYEHEDPKLGWHPDWGSYIFNFGRNEVKSFLVSNALYWLEEFHIDGLRVDGVASMLYLDYSRQAGQWIPNKYGGNENLEAVELLQTVNQHVYQRKPGIITVAEESTSWPGVTRPVDWGGLGFGFKWNMGWMNDSLRYYGLDPLYRQYHHNLMTFAMAYAYSENYVLPISHDEVVHGKGSMYERVPQDEWRTFATMRAFYSFMWSHPGKQLLFQGLEFGQKREFSEQRGIDWEDSNQWGHRGVQLMIKDLNQIYKEHPALWQLDTDPRGFQWIDADDRGGNVFSFLRFDDEAQMIACLINFSPEPRYDYRIGLPARGTWREIFNSDATQYDGTGQVGNLGQITAQPVPTGSFPASGNVSIPPLGAVWLLYDPEAPTGDPISIADESFATPVPAKRPATKAAKRSGTDSPSQPAATDPATDSATSSAPAAERSTRRVTTRKAVSKAAATRRATGSEGKADAPTTDPVHTPTPPAED